MTIEVNLSIPDNTSLFWGLVAWYFVGLALSLFGWSRMHPLERPPWWTTTLFFALVPGVGFVEIFPAMKQWISKHL